MASKNIFSEGYTQLPVLASAPVSVSWLTGQAAVVAPGSEERGMVETTRDSARSRPGLDGGDEVCVGCGCCCCEVVEDELRKGMRQPQTDDVEVGLDSVEDDGGCDGLVSCAWAARACASHASLLLWSTGQASALPPAAASGFIVLVNVFVVVRSVVVFPWSPRFAFLLLAVPAVPAVPPPTSARAFLFKKRVSRRSCCSMLTRPW